MRARLPFVLLGLVVGLLFNALVVFAWTGPQNSPPDCVSGQPGCDPPINVGTTAQIKNGDVGINNISAFGNALLSGLGVGSGRYLNFDYTSDGTAGTGSSGYGIRDNAGTLEFKNLGGSWASLQAIVAGYAGSGQWTTSDNNIYNSNSDNVGIGTASPATKLDVAGDVRASGWMKAGRFYDIDNTNYFVEPANQSFFNDIRTSVLYDFDNSGYYLNPNSTSVVNDMRASIFYDADNTSYYINPQGISVVFDLRPSIIRDNDNTSYYVDPSNTTNLNYLYANDARASYFFDKDNIYYYLNPAGDSILNQVYAYGYSTLSDASLKTDVRPLAGALQKVLNLSGVSFTWKDAPERGSQTGFIAQDMETTVPDLVSTNDADLKAIDYARLTPLLVEAIKEQQSIIDQLKSIACTDHPAHEICSR